ncbi:TYSND1 [Mytilus coruscus]|uniref:Peroxisomal leader peptide-processing protease n=1 Tax=Mytilus coruscus TaxID=42192 RepID=A0A6J8DR73_MYTCO|nr:TYSND1 [Mytilus coruscus]
MFDTGCVVSVKVNGEDKKTLSGVLIDTKSGLVLTHGTLVSSLLTDQQMNSLQNKGILQNNFHHWDAEVCLQRTNIQDSNKNLRSILNSSDIGTLTESETWQKNLCSEYSANVKAIFSLKKLQNVVSFLLPENKWEFVEDFASQETPDDQSKFYAMLSCFIILKLNNWKSYNNNLSVLAYDQLDKGNNLEIEATPFGGLCPEIFLNSRSTGVLSNKAGGILLMTDARCVPGSEGGPVFCRKGHHRYLVGLIITSLCWKANEWVGLSMACAITDVLKRVKQICRMEMTYMENIIRARNNLSEMIEMIPLIVVGSNWGSCVVIGQDNGHSILLTCSHVVKESDYNTVKLKFTDHQKPHKGKVIYKTPVDEQFDIAVLTCPLNSEKHVQISPKPVSQGDRVYVIGHAVFGEEKNLEPTITSGIISKVLCINNVPVMIQTTCAVHAGASGGAIVNQYGQLVGIPVSNAKDTESKATYPHINMCIPIATVAPIIQQYMASRDASILGNLTIKHKHVKKLWMLDTIHTASKL